MTRLNQTERPETSVAVHPRTPTLTRAASQRSRVALKEGQLSVWNMARDTYVPGLEQTAYAGWVYGDRDNWAGTADSFQVGRYADPRNTALMLVGFTGQSDLYNPTVPEMISVLAPLVFDDGHLVVDRAAVLTRTLTASCRGVNSADPLPFSRQFNHTTEARWMHSASAAACQYLAALRGWCGYGSAVGTTPLPVPTPCMMVRRGEPNQFGQISPKPIPFGQLKEDEISAEAYVVLDLESGGCGIDIVGGSVGVVETSGPWRLVDCHVRAMNHQFGLGVVGGTTVDVCFSVR